MTRSLDRSALAPFMATLLANPPRDMRAALTAWAAQNGVELT